jgi:hypothetical protein
MRWRPSFGGKTFSQNTQECTRCVTRTWGQHVKGTSWISFTYDDRSLLPFGTYVHTQEKSSNDMAARTVPALALRPTGNMLGGFFFLSLVSGRTITRGLQSYTTLPMSQNIDQINAMCEQADAHPGVYFSEAADEVPYFPNDDDTVPDDDHILEDDVVSINESKKDEACCPTCHTQPTTTVNTSRFVQQ